MKAKNLTHATSLNFDTDMWEWLQKEAKSRRCSISYLVRELVLQSMRAAGANL